MTILAIQSFKGQSIRIRKEDRYVSLTDMAKASGKRLNDWARQESTKGYIDVLSSVTGKLATELLEINQGGIPESQGTWGHPKVALRFAQWCSDEFAVQVDFWIDELVTTGKVEIVPSIPTTPETQVFTVLGFIEKSLLSCGISAPLVQGVVMNYQSLLR